MKVPPTRSATSLGTALALARAHLGRGEAGPAALIYRRILLTEPRCFEALYLLAATLVDGSASATSDPPSRDAALAEGVELMRRALAVDSSHAIAHFGLGGALLRAGDPIAALDARLADAWLLQGDVLQGLQRASEAIACYQRALELRPDAPETLNNLAAVLRLARRLDEALVCIDRALALKPAYPKALNNRGLIRLDAGCVGEAIEDFERALDLEPDLVEALHNLAAAHQQANHPRQALDAFDRLYQRAPSFPHALGNLLFAKLSCCDWTGIEPLTAAVATAVASGEQAVLPLTLLSMRDSPELQRRCGELYTACYFPALDAPAPSVRSSAPAPIRVAYLSSDFGEHAVTYLLAGVFERHDRTRFETFGITWDRRESTMARRRVEGAFTRFIDVTLASDEEVARTLRELGVDVAVDLMGHTLRQRTAIFARRPAPIQVSFLGLPATMGAPYIDYLIADSFLIPPHEAAHYSENIVHLPRTFQPNDDRRTLAPDGLSRAAHGLPAEALVLCSFNRTHKLNPACFDIWMQLLRQVPQAVLWLLATDPTVEQNLRREARTRGVAEERLIFAPETSYQRYLARYAHADLFLDTLPFNGGTTVSDALSMGLPVLTCAGRSFAARMAGSVLTCLGLAELVTVSLEEYESTALDLLRDPVRLALLRRHLERQRHDFFDTDRYRRDLERAFEIMVTRKRAGRPPDAIDVGDAEGKR